MGAQGAQVVLTIIEQVPAKFLLCRFGAMTKLYSITPKKVVPN